MAKNLGGRPVRYFIVIDGVQRRADEVAKEAGINRNTLYHRIQKGVPKEKWFVKAGELIDRAKFIWNGQEFTLSQFAREHGIDSSTLRARIDAGKSDEDIAAAPNCMQDDHRGEWHCEVHNWRGTLVPHQSILDAGVSVDTVRGRVLTGCSVERALLAGKLERRTTTQKELLWLGVIT